MEYPLAFLRTLGGRDGTAKAGNLQVVAGSASVERGDNGSRGRDRDRRRLWRAGGRETAGKRPADDGRGERR